MTDNHAGASPVRPLVGRLHELRLIYGDTETSHAFADAEIEIGRLQDMLFELGAMRYAPCFCCGYNGPGYYQPATHSCAIRHHALAGARRCMKSN